ncbi:probable G-protein coupled receptor No18 [Dendronephthya gigantea]|uniref:probable G-protein coupled receptor No18 n=1 Tax=Dendronephthya gigantea TaxID=151771 RepID=UPI00106D91FB|nr:probable G-protein coupled receptor No18 [Dendronephthya gigantea]
MAYFQGTFEERCLTTGASQFLAFFTMSLSILFLITSIPGNILVVLAVVRDPYKNLRSPFNFLMTNLSVADLIVGTIVCPLSIHYHLMEAQKENISIIQIRVFHLSYFIASTASVLSLASLAVERYAAIRFPHTYRNKLTGKRILCTIVLIWCISLSLPFVYLEVGFITYAFIFANTSVIVAIVITCFIYALMVGKFRKRSRKDRDDSCTTTSDDSSEIVNSKRHKNPMSINSDVDSVKKRKNAVRLEHTITKMFLVVMAAVLVCYGPSTVLIYTMSFCETCSCVALHWCRDLQFLFVIMNSSLNFFCYALRSPRFRQAFVLILKC